MKKGIIEPKYNHYYNLPPESSLVNPLIDCPSYLKEDNELVEFYKLSNEFYSPEFGIRYLLNTHIYPYQMSIVRAILAHKFPLLLCSRGSSKTFMLGVVSLYYAIMFPGSRIVLVSASFRQSKLIFSEIERIYSRSPLLRAISKDYPRISTDHCHFEVCGSSIKALPLGGGDKIRGERGHLILADEIGSIPIEVFDIVVRGFAATQLDPWNKTREAQLRTKQEIKKIEKNNKDKKMAEFMLSEGNKIVLAGTAGFKNGTFYRLYSQYSRIISNKVSGKVKDYKEIFQEEHMDDDHEIDYRDYCIITFNYKELPLMDSKVIDNARATMPKFLFDMEYLNIFADDSYGFFKMKDIDYATSGQTGFGVATKGSQSRIYVMGVDPARSIDRFAIVLVEVGSPNKIVLVWTSQGKSFSYSVNKMRELMRLFNIKGIAIDQGGGGFAVEEIINNPDIMRDKDLKVYRNDDESPEARNGDRCLYMFNFAPGWIDEANALLQKNIEDRVIMFPYTQVNEDFSQEKDDILFEIAEMKQELVSIEVTHTKSGKKHYDLAPPNLRKDGSSIVKHKDRYSALLLANYLATRFDKLTVDPSAKIRDTYNKSLNFLGWI